MSCGKKTVLIVDDELDAQEVVEAVVREVADVHILTADNGERGLAAATKHQPDLIILDVMMPKKDGFSMFDSLRRDPATAEVPVIMLTALSDKTGIPMSGAAMGEYFGKAPETFIDKPVEPSVLQEAVFKALKL